jgi:predicted transcriptional regulator of viral defense system
MSSANLRENVPTANLAARARDLLRTNGLMRACELRAEGVTPATLSRMVEAGKLVRLGRGVYQLADAEVDTWHELAQAAKRIPKGVICLTSAIAFHGLTDHLPPRVWIAIGSRDWSTTAASPPLRIVRMARSLLDADVERHQIDGVEVKVFSAARSVIDAFRHERSVGRNLALEGLRQALRQRAATPAEISSLAARYGAWSKVRPYLEALTADA